MAYRTIIQTKKGNVFRYTYESGKDWDGGAEAARMFKVIDEVPGVKYYYRGKQIQPNTSYQLESTFFNISSQSPMIDTSPAQDSVCFILELPHEDKGESIGGILFFWGALLAAAITALIIEKFD